ncbi:MAG: dihydroxy-acid dehydratase, partial [Deltaproteobacteria bacterium]|nr:dihydroxy-acid dehydratase [Deltaproteobacteria bacterium]
LASKIAIQGGPKLDQLITKESVENALRVLLSVSGSTNAMIHLTAIAGRAGVEVDLKRFNELSDETPVLVDLKPVGSGYMEDFHSAGGLDGVLLALAPQLNLQTLDVTGQSLEQRLKMEKVQSTDLSVIRNTQNPIDAIGGLIALHGTLAPEGAILKRAAATPALLEHEGRAVVFSSLEDLATRIDSFDLDVEAEDILVLQNAGPRSPSGMPEAGYLPIPKKLAKAGVKDMVRISDARMSGTAFGTIVLHVTPEADLGGPLALVQNGDRIRLSAAAKTIDLLVTPEELERRRSNLLPSSIPPSRGYRKLYHDTILPASQGCDFDFLGCVKK